MPKNPTDSDESAYDNTARALKHEPQTPDVLTADMGLISKIYESELEVIGAIACDLIRTRGVLNFSDIILRLIVQLELTGNLLQKRTLRNAISLVVNKAPPEE
ncbi:hypothetical protein C2125_13935 [Rahnella aquatilis]|jgi:hypothetical protein|nr:biofilm development regulator YmgB/AriR family protein [Rahnella aquatilis]RBQ33752.1 hypothetical protein C2125_13935 [Rahnella aquatilis]